MRFKIESNVPVPNGAVRRKTKYPFRQMKIGDSFEFDIKELRKVTSAAYGTHRRDPDFNYTIAGNRIWKIAPENNKS